MLYLEGYMYLMNGGMPNVVHIIDLASVHGYSTVQLIYLWH